MSKRSHLELQDDDYRKELVDRDVTFQYDGISTNPGVILSLLRMVISRHSRNQKIRKEHFAPILHRYNLKGNILPWIKVLKIEFENLFGITIQLSGNEIVVTNDLNPESRNLLTQLLKQERPRDLPTGSNYHDQFYLLPRHKRSGVIINTLESIFGGLIVLIVSIIVVNENRVREADLLDTLNEFGLSENLNLLVANLNKNVQEILAELVRRDYISKAESRANNQGSQVDYSLGKRSLRELDPHFLLLFMQSMFEHELMRQKCIKTIQRCFPEISIQTQPTSDRDQT